VHKFLIFPSHPPRSPMKAQLLGFAILVVGLALGGVACKSRDTPMPMEPPAPVPPAGYAQPGDEGYMEPGGGAPSGRFGYRGDDPGAPPPPPAPPTGTEPGGMRDIRDLAPGQAPPTASAGETPPAPAPPAPPQGGTPSAAEMPFANPVPGDPLVVTLPGRHASLGPISIEKYDSAGRPTGEPLRRGTQVQIPDPNSPGQKIYFKVP